MYKKLYIHAFDDMLAARKAAGKTNHYSLWTDGEGVFKWWIGDSSREKPLEGQIEMMLEEQTKEGDTK